MILFRSAAFLFVLLFFSEFAHGQAFTVPELRKLCLMRYSDIETYLFNKGLKYKSSNTKTRDDGSKSYYYISEFANDDQSIKVVRQEIKTYSQNYAGVVSKTPNFEFSVNYYFTGQEYLEKYKVYLRENKFNEILGFTTKSGEYHIDYRPENEIDGKISLYSVSLIRKPEGEYPRFGISVTIGLEK